MYLCVCSLGSLETGKSGEHMGARSNNGANLLQNYHSEVHSAEIVKKRHIEVFVGTVHAIEITINGS